MLKRISALFIATALLAGPAVLPTFAQDKMKDTRLGKLATREQDNAARPKASVGRWRRCKCFRWQEFRPRSPMG